MLFQRDQYMRTGQGFLLVYDITNYHSFEDLNRFRDQICRVKDKDSVPTVLIGNKCDLEIDRIVSVEEGKELAGNFNCPFFETSAKNRVNVDESFEALVREVRKSINPNYGKGNRRQLKKRVSGIKNDCVVL